MDFASAHLPLANGSGRIARHRSLERNPHALLLG